MLAHLQHLRNACRSIAIPVRIALSVPLLICTLNGYTAGGSVQSATTYHLPPNMRPLDDAPLPSKADPDATDGMVASSARVLAVYTVSPPSSCRGRALALAFVILALGFSLASVLVAWVLRVDNEPVRDFHFEGLAAGVDHKMAAADAEEGREARGARRKRRLWNLCVGLGTRLLLSALGTTAFVDVLSERDRIRPESYVAIEGLGWTVVAMLYFGVFDRMFMLIREWNARDPEVNQSAPSFDAEKDGICRVEVGSAVSLDGKQTPV
ncbi:hypothetical protein DENSPDRAFT_851268 [Dentipellis sp. KUC8613]|nr:hypothetical protein DENSPDRAFT_851268 [Dentipellis sp. KUC8613]